MLPSSDVGSKTLAQLGDACAAAAHAPHSHRREIALKGLQSMTRHNILTAKSGAEDPRTAQRVGWSAGFRPGICAESEDVVSEFNVFDICNG